MKTNASPYPLTIFYDASCALCRAEMRRLKQRDQSQHLQLVDASAAGFVSPLPGVSVDDMMQRLYGRTAQGQVLHSVALIEQLYRAVGLGAIARLMRLPGLRPLLDAAYPLIARHRQRISRFIPMLMLAHDKPACTDACRLQNDGKAH